ncbi:MAG: DUF167 domain-containing protein [Gammaproteobacteria bacterium]|nr:DUF167 domain-containing protein [Gammaproteobacteria bacterium]
MITIQVRGKPNARISILEAPLEGDIWFARLKSPPVDGKANQELVALLAMHFGCAKAQVSIRSGAAGRVKRVHIEGI